MKVTVDVKACVGHARCAAVAPEVFELNDEGFNVTSEKDIAAALRPQALRGMRACPERIIAIEDAE
jgi:ferredoxin